MKEKEALCHEEALYYKEKREYLKRREEREIEELNLKKELGERNTAPSTTSAGEPSDNNEQIVPM